MEGYCVHCGTEGVLSGSGECVNPLACRDRLATAVQDLRAENAALRATLQDIVDRCEEWDTGTGYYVEAGPVALALHRVAKRALMPSDAETTDA